MSESSQTTKTGRSTRSKTKIDPSKIIKDAVPVTVVHASKPKAQSNDAEKQGKGKTVEKKGTSEVGDDISLSTAKIAKSSKGSSKRKRRDYKSKFALSMSDLVFDSNVNTSEKATEVNPKTVSDVVETIVSTGDNPSLEKLGSDAEKRDLNNMPKKDTLKRKKESSSDSDYDAAEDVATISSPNPKKATAKKVPQGRSVEPKAELEVANDVVSAEITAGLEADEIPVKASANVAATGDKDNADEDEGYATATDEDEDSDSSTNE
ncbi:suppressor protein SRP40-like [Trifolium pratense]|uniref:suppressor protein SRP40-like n=1 Tax=Trifolium pratense TaxID=57577 RepID=UPI001E6956F2|nr:suppressor protein SRP40-like [Trifolium pratense]